ncbi:hypothetical protein T12_13317 [Trichinella patagoniensis]|uniref:Uncharacterized protein n=1 Tax=Trichinella patagoniensis TaxID=990121 RepID=A0A0V0YYG6_9BILA|nr:hypothetical protein T12_13317 [Trichinella patagoniensis]
MEFRLMQPHEKHMNNMESKRDYASIFSTKCGATRHHASINTAVTVERVYEQLLIFVN